MRDIQKLPVLFLQLFSVSLKSYQNKVTKNHIQYNWSAYLSRPYTAGLRGKHTKRQCLSKVRCTLFFFQKKKYKSWYKKHPFRVRFIFFFPLSIKFPLLCKNSSSPGFSKHSFKFFVDLLMAFVWPSSHIILNCFAFYICIPLV